MHETPELVKLYDVANNITGKKYSPSLKRSDAMVLLQEIRESLDAIPINERGEGDWSCDISITYAGSTTTLSKNSAAVALGRLGGSTKSDKKARSSAENGKLGGRPKGKPRKPTPTHQ